MAVTEQLRRAGPYQGDGANKNFPFEFKVFASTELRVVVADSAGAETELGQGYSVTLNKDQDHAPGGVVALDTALDAGSKLVIISDVTYEQPMVLTNQGGFYPEVLNKSADRQTILIQQIKERVDRSLTVPVTETKTPEDLTNELLAAQKEAAQYATQAGDSLKKTQEIEKRLTDQEAGIAAQLTEKGSVLLSQITTEGSSQQALVKSEGEAQVKRIQALYDVAALSEGMACSRRTIEVSADVLAGAEVTLPNGQQYVVGRNHLLLFYNDLYVDPAHFSEVGAVDTLSSKIKLTFDMKHDANRPNRLTALVVPLGRGEVNELIERVNVVEDSLAQLSRSVAYIQQTPKV